MLSPQLIVQLAAELDASEKSRTVQQASQIDEPDFGTLLDDMFFAPWGERLEAGDTVLAGSFTRRVLAKPGDRFDADYGRLGRLQFNLV